MVFNALKNIDCSLALGYINSYHHDRVKQPKVSTDR